jgi:ribosomal protein S18 acetylase RimI-like enzyme
VISSPSLRGPVELREIGPDAWQTWRSVRLDALREAPDAFSSRLAHWQGAGDAEARWRGRLEAVPFNVVAFLDARPVGQASGTGRDSEGKVELISLWVAPEARGRGVGDALTAAVIAWARRQGARRVALQVRRANDRAVALYARQGFAPTGQPCQDAAELEMALDLGG